MDEVIGEGNSYHKRSSQYQEVFLEEQLVQVLHAGSVCLADSYLAIPLADVEERDAEQAKLNAKPSRLMRVYDLLLKRKRIAYINVFMFS